MSRYSGSQGKGAKQRITIQKRNEAQARQADTNRVYEEEAHKMGWASYEEWKANDFEAKDVDYSISAIALLWAVFGDQS